MLTILTIFHLFLAVSLIVFVMLQDSKGGGAFGMGGGSATQGIFGASGAGNFLVTATKWLAVLFAGTCLWLSYLTLSKGDSVTEGYQAPAAAMGETKAPAAGNAQDAAAPAAATTPSGEASKEAPKK